MASDSLKEKTARGLMWSSVGNGAQLVLGCVFGIFLARLLAPADYGMVGVLQVFLQIAALLQDSGFRQALANRREFRHEDFNAVFWFNVAVAGALYAVLFFAAPLITQFYKQSGFTTGYDLDALTPLTRVCALGFVVSAFGTAHSAYLFRTLQVKQKAIITVTSLTVSNLVGITMALCGCSYWSLAVQSLVYVTSNSILFWHFSQWRPTWGASFRPLREMFAFSSKLLATWIFNCINNNILTVTLGRFYSIHDVGYFNQAAKWSNMGSNWLQGTVQEVAQPVLRGVSAERERHKRVFRKMLRFTSFLCFPALFGLAFVAKEFIEITLTDKWLVSAELMQILCACAFTVPIGNLCMNLVITKERSDMVLKNTLGCGAAQLAAVFISHPYGIHVMVCAFAGVNVAWLFVYFLMVRREIGLKLREALADMVPYAGLAGVSILIASFAAELAGNIYARLLIKVAVTAGLYVGLMWLSGSVTFKESISYLRGKLT